MQSQALFSFVADVILVIHVLFVVFVVLSLFLIFAGKLLCWQWVRNPWFRVTHLLSISLIVFQSWFGAICPLTIWEMDLRSKAGKAHYEGSFIMHWLNELLYYQAPQWVFVLVYTVFGGLVLGSWFWVRPRSFSNRFHQGDS